MTTTPAMPELPDVPLIRFSTGHGVEWAKMYTADQMRAYAIATLQAQPAAAVSDEEINRIVWEHTRLNPNQAADSGLMLCIRNAVRAILALRPQEVPMTDEPQSAPKLIGWRTENFLWETDDVDKARNWEPNIGVLPIFEGDPNTKLGSRGITAQGAQGEQG